MRKHKDTNLASFDVTVVLKLKCDYHTLIDLCRMSVVNMKLFGDYLHG